MVCSGPIIYANYVEQGHSNRDCLNLWILCANCQGKYCANDRNCIAKLGFYLHFRNALQKEVIYQHLPSQNYFINFQFLFSSNASIETLMFDTAAPPFIVNE